jgi:phospholipid-translocating ATPase
VLVIDGPSVERCLEHNEQLFFHITTKLPGVLCCRSSPTQKTLMVQKMKSYSQFRVAAIGDGGNDVGMIQEADVGIGIVGKEGKQASLAADFSILQFSHMSRLLFWHGRLSYLRTAALSQFVVHRGLIVAIVQTLFSLLFYYSAISMFNSYLLLGYATVYTFAPVFTLVTDQDVDDVSIVIKYPRLYQGLQKGRALSLKTLLGWTAQSLFQGAVVMLGAVIFFEDSFVNIVIINFSALLLIELLNLVTELHRKTRTLALSILASLGAYVMSLWVAWNHFDLRVADKEFVFKILAVAFVAWLPIHGWKFIWQKLVPSDASKIGQKR